MAAAAAPQPPAAGAMDDVNARCTDHPYGPNPGGICALCLQEKLGKLVSSSNFAATFFPVSLSSGAASSSFSPSLPSPTIAQQAAAAAAAAADSSSSISSSPAGTKAKKNNDAGTRQRHSRFPFLVYAAHGHIRKRNKKGGTTTGSATSGGRMKPNNACSSTVSSNAAAAAAVPSSSDPAAFVLKRSKSVAPRPAEECAATTPAARNGDLVDSPRKRWFWSFLYLSFHSQHHSQSSSVPCNADLTRKHQHHPSANDTTKQHHPTADEQDGGAHPASTHKVSRSRSVGCGSRSFSSDFLERISTGLVGDCTLRRVESQRDHAGSSKHQQPSTNNTAADSNNSSGSSSDSSNGKVVVLRRLSSSGADSERRHRVRWCGGIFGGLGMVSSSFSSSFWFPEELCGGGAARAQVDTDVGVNAAVGGASTASALETPRGGRGKGWSWALSGPIRAFKPSSSSSTKPCPHRPCAGR